MKLRVIASRNPSAIYRYPIEPMPEEVEGAEDEDSFTNSKTEIEPADDGIPDDTGNRLPSGGRTGNPKIDKFQGYRIPPMY